MSATMAAGRRHARREEPATLQLHVQLDGAFPPVWRRLAVMSDLGLADLHDVLQVAFGWEDAHLHRFTTGPELAPGTVFAGTADLANSLDDDDTTVPTWDVRVDELLGEVGERLHYQYDYGDNWWLAIEVEDVLDGQTPPGRVSLLEGAGDGPPEDCGGVHGYRMIVAAADPTHPEHRQALDEVAAWWGRSVAPDEFGLVPFDRDAVAGRLQDLDLAGRAPVPRRVGGPLAALLLRVRDSDTERRLLRLASTADTPGDIDESTATRMVRPFTVLLDTIGDGVKLTGAGYLPPAVVQTVFDELGLGDEWIGKGNREDLTVPVLQLRETAQQLKLLRKYKGRLVPTDRGRKLAGDPSGLWWHLAGSLPIGGRDESDAAWQAGVLYLAQVASGSIEDAEVVVAALLTRLGWAVGDGQPVARRDAVGLIATDVGLLERVGALEADRQGGWPRAVTDDGVALARASLTGRGMSWRT